ncbi:MAG TPA: hypothetical protein PLH57_12075 [Oligoflexia bacterium]|nr:hypothetical protein [Oligoflexia bacterium]
MSTTSLEQDLHNRLPKAPDLIYCTARGHWPVPSAAQLTPTSNRLKPTDDFFGKRSLEKRFNGKVRHRTAPLERCNAALRRKIRTVRRCYCTDLCSNSTETHPNCTVR